MSEKAILIKFIAGSHFRKLGVGKGLHEQSTWETRTTHGNKFNYYPPCPEPELTYGLPAHADPNVITILLQDDVSGLQVLNDAKWIAVNPIPNTFIVNIGLETKFRY